jgi:hypothetical protein
MITQSSLADAVFLPCANAEPPLADLLSDPIVHMLMSSDHVRATDLQHMLTAMKRAECAG